MSPSRGLLRLTRFTRTYSTTTTTPPPSKTPIELLRVSPHRLHIYRSTSTNPFFNLSAEDYLLRHSPPTSTILFTYTNSPSIVIGRNQNIWSEVNIPLLNSKNHHHQHKKNEENGDKINLVRRRSGGGTVYHDLGNLCWSVIMPRKAFDRDFNAHVVVKALHALGVSTATINDRHDIILRQQHPKNRKFKDLKVSGSAYKIIRERAYHHATLLLNSKLEDIRGLLRSPLKEFITTKGVESVRSEVSNIGVDKEELVEKIEEEFLKANGLEDGEVVSRVTLEEEETVKAREYIREGMMELQSQKWLYSQTPEFTLNIPPQTPLPEITGLPGVTPSLPEHSKFTILSTTSLLQNIQISTSPDPDYAFLQSQESHIRLLKSPFRGSDIKRGLDVINSIPEDDVLKKEVGRWLEVAVGEWGGIEAFDRWKNEDGGMSMRLRAVEREREREDEKERIMKTKEGKVARLVVSYHADRKPAGTSSHDQEG
ncbi:Biotin/lipoate A/B protein ligase [Orbilia blumenaviensis]|uniref:Putative lipoate-protein ligase A n=1 Tax=Orbilia blumenaviensis TaxID=1796055 RepID=A0AAV9U564_9PEZI